MPSTPSPLPLHATGVTRSFDGRDVLRGITLTVNPGEIHALLGPNGAGKTTLTKICSGMLTPTTGTVFASGIDVVAKPRAARSRIGLVLGGDGGFYGRASARDNLLFFADVAGVVGRERQRRVDEVLELVRLRDDANRRVREFSRGMKQRLHLARGMLSRPRLLLLDEVTSGLDPDIAREVRTLIADLAKQGAGILFTSHLLTEVERLADRISVLRDGRIELEGSVNDVLAASGVTAVTTLVVRERSAVLDRSLAELGDAAAVRREAGEVAETITIAWRRSPDLGALAVHELDLATEAITRRATLEEAYLALLDRPTSIDVAKGEARA